MSMQAVIQKQKTANMFKVFDTDGSGALDAQELTVLYKQNGVHVEESDIEKMYGDPKVKFTLEMFDQLPKQPQALKTYRSNLRDIRHKLVREAEKEGIRGFIPTTFDSMMLDFGNRLKRKELSQTHDEVM